MRTVLWFRNNLRVFDNPAIKHCPRATIFIYVWDKGVMYNDNYVHFLLDSLKDLAADLDSTCGGRLHLFYDQPHKLIPRLCDAYSIDRVVTCQSHVVEDLTPLINNLGKVQLTVIPDATLFPLGVHVTKQNIQQINAHSLIGHSVEPPHETKFNGSLIMVPCMTHAELSAIVVKKSRTCNTVGGRAAALRLLGEHVGFLLVPYLELGCISIREAYDILCDYPNVSYLYQRELMLNIAYLWPQMLQNKWEHDGLSTICSKLCTHDLSKKQRALLILWESGTTGYKGVDNIIAKISQDGMITINEFEQVISFLQCVFAIHWTRARAYFSQKILVAPWTIYTEMLWVWIAMPAHYLDSLLQ